LPDALLERIRAEAEADRRSVNRWCEIQLERAVAEAERQREAGPERGKWL
jgi:hypothetical protein